jgi:hypothetical protein
MPEEEKKKNSKYEGLRKFGLAFTAMIVAFFVGYFSLKWDLTVTLVKWALIFGICSNIVADHLAKIFFGLGKKNGEEVKP